ncbi:hypothetical protein EVAR_32870_1 [Eumeta japonica]|uniref:Uncharacterized protein n=1 Tax=Eumeta variegata TaxID=151549 RepID=A0A4C1VS75_EUMVA|nr:hypothetical protein EVAR_32870_1 [Eumeta japonica]
MQGRERKVDILINRRISPSGRRVTRGRAGVLRPRRPPVLPRPPPGLCVRRSATGCGDMKSETRAREGHDSLAGRILHDRPALDRSVREYALFQSSAERCGKLINLAPVPVFRLFIYLYGDITRRCAATPAAAVLG